MKNTLPVVAIVGRPNVGKSTLFNAFVGRRKAIVSGIAGTTRDSVMERVNDLGDRDFWLVDTAGLTNAALESLEEEMQLQAKLAVENADLVLWLVDGRAELTQDDYQVAKLLRKDSQKVLFCANKIDDGNPNATYELAELGFGLPEIVSAKNNFGFWDLTEKVDDKLSELGFELREKEVIEPENEDQSEESVEETSPADPLKVALVGRPNVGKSTLFNALLGENRSVVSGEAGTTRDAIDTELVGPEGEEYTLIDTAGVRKSGKLGREIEYWSAVRTQQSIERSDVCVLLLDALDGVTHQDLVLAGRIVEAGKGLVIAVNKFDLAIEKSRTDEETDERELDTVPMWGEEVDKIRDRYLNYLHQKISFVPWAPVLFFSGKTKRGLKDLFPTLQGIAGERLKRVPTRELNLFIHEVYYQHVAPSRGTKFGKIKYASQVDTNPPKFLIFVNNTEAFHFSYKRYLENKIRDKFGFMGTPIELGLRDQMGRRRKSGSSHEETDQ